MNESEWESLREHLSVLQPMMEQFCHHYAFSPSDPMTLGRYPRLRIERGGDLTLWFDLWMALDDNGKYYSKFHSNIPYDLSAGVYFETEEGSERTRYDYSFACLERVPFSELTEKVTPAMTAALPRIAAIERRWLLSHGRRVVLS